MRKRFALVSGECSVDHADPDELIPIKIINRDTGMTTLTVLKCPECGWRSVQTERGFSRIDSALECEDD